MNELEVVASIALSVGTFIGAITAFAKLGEIVGSWGDDFLGNNDPKLARKFRALTGFWGTGLLLWVCAITVLFSDDISCQAKIALVVIAFTVSGVLIRLVFLIKEDGPNADFDWRRFLGTDK